MTHPDSEGLQLEDEEYAYMRDDDEEDDVLDREFDTIPAPPSYPNMKVFIPRS